MAEIKDLQLEPQVEALQPSIEHVSPKVEINTITTPAQIARTQVQPLATHPAGKQIETALEKETIGKDTPDLDISTSDTTQGGVWRRILELKRQGAVLPA